MGFEKHPRRGEAAKVVTIYSALLWLYTLAIVFDPYTTQYQTGPFSVYIPIPTDLVGMAAFVVSFIAALVWRLS